MASFYFTPVKGEMPIHLIETIMLSRLEYLNSISKGETAVYSEYMIEGSVYDNVGYFMLCIMSSLCKNTSFTYFISTSESKLFSQRIQALSSYDLRRFAKKILRSIKKHDNMSVYIESLHTLCQHLLLKDLAQHICTSTHCHSCIQHFIHINFKSCLPFIAKRLVEIKNGIASIPCGRWIQYLTELFKTNMKSRLDIKTTTSLENDPRILEIVTKLLHKNNKLSVNLNNNISYVLLSKNVNQHVKHFPPCMMHLHTVLRNKHRLSHEQRFYYSLFLKDIGMPVEEAIDFWRQEYRQTPSGSHTCCHSWEKDERKYLYGIRHLYGLEGGRKNYSSVSCSRIQGTSNACSEGGCPFKTFDQTYMNKILDLEKPESQECLLKVNNLRNKRMYSLACKTYLKMKFSNNFNNDGDKISFNFNPVIYYKHAAQYEIMK